MYIYNVTVKIDISLADEWLQWMKEVHIPDVMATKCFTDYRICKILEDDNEGKTFATQYYFKTMEDIIHYQNRYAPELQRLHKEKYQNHYVAFRTLMEVV